ncbi:MAG TPA: aspartate--tRNA ligase [Ruminococcaceae bacterium]|nr:aspartate--tRNA ligase [Oscillospiraceae bacterium]
MYRSKTCGELRIADVGIEVTLAGWVHRLRKMGGMTFVELRDRYGITQLVFNEQDASELFAEANALGREFVIQAKGTVAERYSKNSKIPTGDIEIIVNSLKVLNKSETPPFTIEENTDGGDDLRMKYRYLDLRRPDLQSNILLRHKIAKVTRDYFDENGFVEIETPILIRSTPEGARDYIVPSRVHKGSFYALPQSPQLYKQLSMVAGFDRYMQIARCFRDEDLRADRQPEFTQIDLEMSFVEMDDVLAMGEGYIKRLFKEVLDVDVPTPIMRLTYQEAMERYGSDKPDTRYAMELYNLTDEVKDCGFSVFSGAVAEGGSVRGITAKGAVSTLTRKEIDKLTEFVKGSGAKGLAWIRMNEDGTMASSFAKFMTEDEMQAILAKAGAEKGDVVLIIADKKNSLVLSTLGLLRGEVARKLDIIPKNKYNFLWIVEFPFFDWDEELGQFVAMHHPFTAPLDECIPYLESDKANVRAKAYDLVLNGIELSSGSIRITNPELQAKIFELLGLTDEQAHEKFGYLLDAFRFGAPPHGGMGLGLDRLIMQMLGCESLRDVIAFPKVQNATEPMTECPAPVDDIQLTDLGIGVISAENK